MKSSVLTFALLVVLAGAAAACSPEGTSANKADLRAERSARADVPGIAKEISPNTYQNATIGLTISAPEGWYVADSELMRKIMKAGAEAAASNMSAVEKAGTEASVERTGTIFSFSQFPPDSPVDFSAQLMGLTEDVSMMPGIKRGSDYLFHVRRSMMQSTLRPTIADGYVTRKIGGQDFDRMDASADANGQHVLQRYYAAPHKGLVFTIIQTYRNEQDLAELDKVLDGIVLDW